MNGLLLGDQNRHSRSFGEASPVGDQGILSDWTRAWYAPLPRPSRSSLAARPEQTARFDDNPFARLYSELVPWSREESVEPPEPAPKVRRVPVLDRSRELKWIAENRTRYPGKWVALEGDTVIAVDDDAKVVFAATKAVGIVRPFVVHLEPADSLPFGGW